MIDGSGLVQMVGGIQGTEVIILLLIIVFLLFGSKKLPELAKSIGKATAELQRGKAEVQREILAAQETVSQPASEVKDTMYSIGPAALSTPVQMLPAPINPTLRPTTSSGELERLRQIAKDLGIDVEGKGEQDIREEISHAMLR